MEKTHWKKIVSDPNYIGEGDFQPGEEKIVTIDKVVSRETVKTAEGKSDRAVVYFKEDEKPMILNVARSKSISKVTGSPYFEDWPGARIQLYVQFGIKAFGDVVNAVRVRDFVPRIIKCSECGCEVKAYGKMSASDIATKSKETYGKVLCIACSKKAQEARNEIK